MAEIWPWIAFNTFIIIMLLLDLFVLHRDSRVIDVKEAVRWSIFWISLALLFNVLIYFTRGTQDALDFLAAYLIEESLSLDNLFVFILLFSYFRTPPQYLHRVLFFGILGAILMRAFFIIVGLSLISWFSSVLYLFGAFLIYMGFKMAFKNEEDLHPEKNPLLRILRTLIPITKDYVNGNFFVIQEGRRWATPLFVVLIAVETTDVIFAIDSIPAVFAITLDPFIVYTSNIFAVLGLRSIFFALAGAMGLFHFLHYGLAVVLIFVGIKMMIGHFIEIPILMTLGVIAICIGGSIVASLWLPKK